MLVAVGLLACSSRSAPTSGPTPAASASVPEVAATDVEQTRCHARIADLLETPALAGTPDFDAVRADVLGRARGEPVVLVRAPVAELDEAARRAFEKSPPGRRVDRLVRERKGDLPALRKALLPEGYVYAPLPEDALALSQLHLRDFFDEPSITVERGVSRRIALRKDRRDARAYAWADGGDAGREADLQFGDRITPGSSDAAAPIHRDFRLAAAEMGFERARLLHLGERAIVAELRFGQRWTRAVLESDGAHLALACREAPDEELRALDARVEADAPRRRSLAKLSGAVSSAIEQAFRFDRPEGEKTAERDGQLRPFWYAAYLRGSSAFELEGTTYPTRDASGQPWPPEVCVDFVLDCYERAAGTWFRGPGEPPGRVRGALDFDALGIQNRRGVLGFLTFAERAHEHFEVRHFQGPERVPFGDRKAFFRFLLEHADELRPGDVLAIQGRKADGLIHQHAILLERTDPLTGFAYGLADQMKRPRRRTWEGIMAEAPLRSLLYRVRPTDAVLLAGETVSSR